MNDAASKTAMGGAVSNHDASAASLALPDDLSREVYCLLGIPLDAITMHEALRRIKSAATARCPFLISTPNLNFLVTSQSDASFRGSLILSDLCSADGMPIIWIAWLTGVPIRDRIAGADILDALKTEHGTPRPLKIFLFGGPEGVAAAASRAINDCQTGLCCVGSLFPGFGSVEEMSRDDIINSINMSGADFLVVSLGGQKGQSWLQRNHCRLSIPVRAHLGAAINFQAGTIRRAPAAMRRLGFEWLWRIKEEPYLWRRYWNDGKGLIRLLLTHVLPFSFWTWWLRTKHGRRERHLVITTSSDKHGSVVVKLSGRADAQYVEKAIAVFREVIATKKRITLDFSTTHTVDARFLGLLLMLNKALKGNGASLGFVGLSSTMQRIFRLNGLELD